MTLLEGPALGPGLACPAEDFEYEVGPLLSPIPPAPPVGDPDTEYVPGTAAPLVQVLLGRAITREVIGELVTAVVRNYDRDVELLAGSTAAIEASAYDPLWEACAETTGMAADGEPVYTFDPKGFVVWIYVDQVCVWTGRFTEPIQFGGGIVVLPAQGPQVAFNERILGRAEQFDELGDRGSFEQYDSIAAMEADGWQFPDTVTPTLVADGLRGTKALQLTGPGWVRSPKVMLDGADGYQRVVDGQAFGKWQGPIQEGREVTRTSVQVVGTLAEADPAYADANRGRRPDNDPGWSDSPIESAGRMAPVAQPHWCRQELASFPDVTSTFDLVALRLSQQTGFPKGTYRDLAYYVVRILRDLHARSLGGSPTGLTTRVMALTGVETSQRWPHAQRTPVRDVLSAVLDQEGGPECRITAGWVLEIWDRLGEDRDDIGLSVHDILQPEWQIDPGARVTDFVVDTGRGSGVSWLSATVATPEEVADDAWRTVAIVQGPVDRSLNEIESWARAHARAAARLQVTSEVEVPWHVAEQINEGDTLMVTQHDGTVSPGENRMRVLRMRFNPLAYTCTLTLGATGA